MKRLLRGAALGKYLLLLFLLVLFVAFLWWRQSYGTIGRVDRLDFSTADYIAFVRPDSAGQSNLYVVRADGTGLKRLTSDRAGKRAPAWSPDGRTLCYAAESGSTYQIFLLGNGSPRQATYGSISKDSPRWRPDGKQVAYLAGGAIKVMLPNGSDTEQIYPPPHRGNAPSEQVVPGQPTVDESALRRPPITRYAWSPNGVAIAGVQVLEGENAPTIGTGNWWQRDAPTAPGEPPPLLVAEPESVVVLPNLETEQPLVLPGATKVGFSWFPDSRRIALSLATHKGQHGVLVFRTDEKDLPAQPIFVGLGYTASPDAPAVSPDGSKIAFEVWRVESSEDSTLLGIAVVPTEPAQPLIVRTAAEVARIPIVIRGGREPRWSPDGTRLLYWRSGPGGRDLWVAQADGSGAVNLTKGHGDSTDAVWSPVAR